MENSESLDAGDKPRDVDMECTFSHHVKKLHSTKTVAICETSSKLNRTGEKVDEVPLQNGHALKRHNEENLGITPHQDHQLKNASSKLNLSRESSHEKLLSSCPSFDPNEAAGRKSDGVNSESEVGANLGGDQALVHSSPNRNDFYISPTDVTVPCKSGVLGQARPVSKESVSWNHKNVHGSDESIVAKGFDTSKQLVEKRLDGVVKAGASHMRESNDEISAKSSSDPSVGAGIDSQIIMSLAAAARSSVPSVEMNEVGGQGSCIPNSHLQVWSLIPSAFFSFCIDNVYIPKVGGIKFALEDLASFVGKRGGFQNVIDSKLWSTVAKDMGIDTTKVTNAGSTLKRLFQQHLLDKPSAHTESPQIYSSAIDRSTLAAKLLAKRKANEAVASASMSQSSRSDSKDEKRSETSAIQSLSSDSAELKALREMDDQSDDQKSGVKVEYDSDGPQGTRDEEDSKSSVRLKKECDSKAKSKTMGDSIMKSETETSKSAKDDARSFRDTVSSKSSSSVARDGEPARRKSRRDTDGMGQLDDTPERKLSRDERKFRSILRQIELLEKKQKGPDGVTAPSSGDASPRRPGSWDNEIELASLTRRRKDLLKEEFREKERDRDRIQDRERKEKEKEKEKEREKERKEKEQEMVLSGKKRPAPQSRDSGTPQPSESILNSSKKLKGPSKQTPAKVAPRIPGRRSSKFSDDRLQGPLVVLREYRRAARKGLPCLPRVMPTASAPAEQPEIKSTMRSKKAHILSSVANESDGAQYGTRTGALWDSEVPSNLDPFRLNPFRKPKDKLIFPIAKRLLQQWTDLTVGDRAEDPVSVLPVIKSELCGEGKFTTVTNEPEPMELDQDLEMDVDSTGFETPSGSQVVDRSGSDQVASVEGTSLQPSVEMLVSEKASAFQDRPEESKVKDLRSESIARDSESQEHRPSAETVHVSSQNRRPHGQDRGAELCNQQTGMTSRSSIATEQRLSPPLSPVSSTGFPSRHGSPADRGGADSCSRAIEVSASHRRPASQETPVASPRNRHSTWDQSSAGDRVSHEAREGRDSRERRDRDRDRDRDSRTSSREALLSHSSGRDTSLHRDRLRELSPVAQSLRRRLVSPPRALFTGELRERGLQLSEGGLSRESLRRERQGLSAPSNGRATERLGLATSTGLVRDRDRLSSLNGSVEHPIRQNERSGSKHWPAELGRALSPSRSQDRGERGLVVSERLGLERAGLDRGGLGGGNSACRERSLSPRSKEALREMQVARERRAKEMPADTAEPGEIESPSASGRWSGAATRPSDHWWSSSPSSSRNGLALSGGLRSGAGSRVDTALRIGGAANGGIRRERPSMFDHRRGR